MYILLTLLKHKDGVWVTQLVYELQKMNTSVKIVTAEELLHETRVDMSVPSWLEDSTDFLCEGIVNRISDAADPILVKRCLAVLTAATQLYNIPVFNGPIAYSLCCNKWCHHAIFTRAGLDTPTTAVLLPSQSNGADKALEPESILGVAERVLGRDRTTYLLKPNSGGFGAGITRIKYESNVDGGLNALCPVADDTVLLQTYVPPLNGSVYRVWFLCGIVQCAVQRRTDLSDDEFRNGCLAGGSSCTLGPKHSGQIPLATAWPVPEPVKDEIEGLLKLLHDAHAGSVEFLVDGTTGQRLYFDLNLLSTLPGADIVGAGATWGEDYNPWSELAEKVIQVLKR